MKLALATLSIVRIDATERTGVHRGRPVSNILLRSNSVHSLKIWRPSGGLVARWHVSPETGRIECRWSMEELPADDHLCTGYSLTPQRPRRLPWRASLRGRPIFMSRSCH